MTQRSKQFSANIEEIINLESEDETELVESSDEECSIITTSLKENQPSSREPDAVDNNLDPAKNQTPLFEIKFTNQKVFKSLISIILPPLYAAFDQNKALQVDFTILNECDNDIRIQAHDHRKDTPSHSNVPTTNDNMRIPNKKNITTSKNDQINAEDGELIENSSDESVVDLEETEENLCTDDLFKIDAEPAVKHDAVQIPSYKRTIKDVLVEKMSNEIKKSPNECCRPKKSSMCFNCSSLGHSLKDCPKPRNQKKINQAKKVLMGKQERYHVDNEQRFAHLRPGKISEKLKSALGLRKGELPFFFYRMRVLGYPPGWLEDAKVAHSGITLFNSEGQEVLESDDEEGQLDVDKCKYDASKIIGFPGFNVDPGPKFFDDFKYHQVPPLNPCDGKEEFIKILGDNVIKGYKRKKLKDLPGTTNDDNDEIHVGGSIENLQESDMEIEDEYSIGHTAMEVIFTRPLPPSDPPMETIRPPPPPPPETPPKTGKKRSYERREQSPSLEDLEAKQKKLLHELQSNTSANLTDDSLITEIIERDNEMENLADSRETERCISDNNQTPNSSICSPQTPITKSATKESHLGTPILKFSPFDKLPCGDHFKVGVSEMINFENLPDSTGKYEQMKMVIKKVRKTITKLYNEDD